eukprot:7888312-Alexandrium_andersonii.AAC.1
MSRPCPALPRPVPPCPARVPPLPRLCLAHVTPMHRHSRAFTPPFEQLCSLALRYVPPAEYSSQG